MTTMRILAVAIAITLASMKPSSAHQIWIQPDAKGALQLHFGEFNENLKEVSPGESIVVENASAPIREVKAEEKITRTIYHASARFVPDLGERGAVLTLDILPAAENGRFKLMFRGAPLVKAKVNVVSESGWTYEARTGEAGTFEAKLPWKGLYVIEATYTDRTAGVYQDRPYDAATFVTTLSFVTAAGQDTLPLPPVAKPAR